MKAIEFKGIIPPIITPFTKDGQIFEKGLRELLDFIVPHVHGLYPVGTYGCGPMMTVNERKKAAEIIVDQVNKRIPIIMHVGCADTNTTVELAKHAESIGAEAVGAIAPYYYPATDEAIFNHFRRLIESVNIPVFLYNNPHYSGNTIKPAVVKRLAQCGLGGVKDGSFDLVNFYMYKMAVKDYPECNVIVGTEAIFLGAFEAGSIGAVTGVGNVYPELLNKLYTEYTSGDMEKAKQTQIDVLKVRDITKYGPTIPTMHAILKMRGLDVGYPREPFLPISKEIEDKVKAELKEMNLL